MSLDQERHKRIVTTHVGSLPRPDALAHMMADGQTSPPAESAGAASAYLMMPANTAVHDPHTSAIACQRSSSTGSRLGRSPRMGKSVCGRKTVGR